MSVFKKLKSVFIVDEGSASSNNEQKKESSSNSGNESINYPSTSKEPTITFDPESIKGSAPDSKFLDILFKAIEDANVDGFDYLEFKTSLQSLSKMNMDEGTRYQSALAMSKTMNASPEKLVQSANHYLSVLKQENDKFNQAVSAQKQKLAIEQTEGIKAKRVSIENKKKQILQLQEEINRAEQELAKTEEEINSSANKIAETSAKFTQAYETVVKQIVDDIKNINLYSSKA